MRRDWTIVILLNVALLANLGVYFLLAEQDWQETPHLVALLGVHVPVAIGLLIWSERVLKRLKRRRKGL
jgi:hypothetical protein